MPKLKKVKLAKKQKISAFTNEKILEELGKGAQAFAVSAEDTITIFENIGVDPWTGEGFTLKRLDAALRSIGDKDVTIYINSNGGSYYEGLGIYNRLLDHPGKITVKVLGMAASAASVIAMAADEIMIAPQAQIMIHDASIVMRGNRHDMMDAHNWLGKYIDTPMAGVYCARTGKEAADVSELMKAETYFTGQEAIDAKFADSLLEAAEVTACAANPEPPVRRIESILTTDKKLSRTEARNLINEIKGTQDAADDTTQDAGEKEAAEIAALIKAMET